MIALLNDLLCRIGLHNWLYLTGTWRVCAHCGRHESFKIIPPGWAEWPAGKELEQEWRER